LVTTVNCVKTAVSVEMPIGVVDRVGPRNHVLLDGVQNSIGRSKFLGNGAALTKKVVSYLSNAG